MSKLQPLKFFKENFLIVLLSSSIFICLSFAFSVLVIKDFSNPLDGVGDIGIWEYMGFYLSKNLNILPFPTLNLTNNQVFYPYGTNSVFQGWGIEKDLFYALFYLLFGIGSWLQIYYLLSVETTVIGTFLLLRRDYGLKRAAAAGFLVSFANFYALHKYPAHFDNSVLHWTTLSFITDFLIVKKFTLRQNISLKLILLRALLFVLSLGQGLGYIAGFALMSFSVSTIFIASLFIYRYYKKQIEIDFFLKEIILKKYHQDFKENSYICYLLLGSTFIISYLYFPLVLQLTKEAKSFDFSQVPSGAWWTNPLRLLLPILPNLRPLYGGELSFKIFRDSSEGFLAGSPGLFLLITGILGLWQARKRILIFVPLIIIFLLFLTYDPGNFPTIRIFPWFAFNRVGGRSTSIYPVILCLFSLHLNFANLPVIRRKVCSVLLVFLACLELYTAYSFKNDYQPYSFVPSFYKYMDYVKTQPGEAVLDFPFCAIGGNGVGAQELCPYFSKNGSVYGLRRFHDKKVMGQAFARLHPLQIQPYLQAGWHRLFFPDNPEFPYAVKQKRCFKPDEWSFFTEFFKLNDFAGINLYVDLLPEQCINEFYKRFGYPTMETVVPGAGRVKFLPKSAELRSQVNLSLGTKLKFEPILNFSESNLLGADSDRSFLEISGLAHQEGLAPNNWRWGLGAETSLKFKLPQNQILQLSFRFINPITEQDVVVEANGKTLIKIKQLNKGFVVDKSLNFQGFKGINTISFKYKFWNKNPVKIAPQEERPLSIQFTKLLIQPE